MILLPNMFNKSSTAKYLISYKRPSKIINEYKFQVELIAKLATSMYVSAERHTCYFFCRVSGTNVANGEQPCLSSSVGDGPCGLLFQSAWDVCKSGDLDNIIDHVDWQQDIFLQKVQRIRSKPDYFVP